LLSRRRQMLVSAVRVRQAEQMSRLPPVPPERDLSPRARIASVLREELVTARELSQRVGVSEKDVTLHLEHLARSARHAGERMVVAPAGCLGCGFAFEDRERFSKPGRCPRCRGTHISPPRFALDASA
jgi:predicted Zn-ribbon and HTH transcriptional regulator